MIDVVAIAGTRPECIKLGPVVAALRAIGLTVAYLHTGQHPDASMSGDGPWPMPDVALTWTREYDSLRERANYAAPRAIRDAVVDVGPVGCVVVQGDTASTLAGANAASLLGVSLVHVEAGLRCWDDVVPEEKIRVEVDQRADLLLCPSPLAVVHAKASAKPGAVVELTGQTGLDAFAATLAAEMCSPRLVAKYDPWILLTLHRAELDRDQLIAIVERVAHYATEHGYKVRWPAHPKWSAPEGSELPWSYRETVRLLTQQRPALCVTDSGGLVEECHWLRMPTVIVRNTTERSETLAHNAVLAPPKKGPEFVGRVVDAMLGQAPEARTRIGTGAEYTGSTLTRNGDVSPSQLVASAVSRMLRSRR